MILKINNNCCSYWLLLWDKVHHEIASKLSLSTVNGLIFAFILFRQVIVHGMRENESAIVTYVLASFI